MFHWVGTVAGVADTPYSGHSYKLSIEFTADYPYKAPVIKFTTPIFHPNVDVHGNICLDILKEKWSATYSVKTVLISLQVPRRTTQINAMPHGAAQQHPALIRTRLPSVNPDHRPTPTDPN